MSIVWLIVLIIFGCVMGFGFSPLFWWLLVSMALCDLLGWARDVERMAVTKDLTKLWRASGLRRKP